MNLKRMRRIAAILGPGTMFVGSITTPASGSQPTVGNADGGTGAQTGITSYLAFQNCVTDGTGGSGLVGNGSASNLSAALSLSDVSTNYCQLSVTGNGANNQAAVCIYGGLGFQQRFEAVQLILVYGVPENSLSPAGSEATFGVAISLTGTSGSFTARTDTLLIPPATQAEQTYQISNIGTFTLADVALRIGCYSYSTQTSGTCTANIYACYLWALS